AARVLTGATTVRYWRVARQQRSDDFSLRPFLVASLLLGLTIAYIMTIVLLIHEGVDHVL
ncbi:MAG: hypothetical protein L0191_00160, partial [Acidobacteria bacterium]|nr:hypothetical protein [Acidobacteriota bacterium]